MKSNGRTFQRGKTQWIAYYLDGKEFRESAESEEPKDAEKLLKKRLKEIGADQLGVLKFTTPQIKKLTIHDLLESLKADFELRKILGDQNRSGIKLADEAFGKIKAVAFGSKQVKAYIKTQSAAGYKNATINRVTGFVEQAFALAVTEDRWFTKIPHITRLSEAANVRQGFCSKEEFLRVHENLPADLQDFALFAFSTGMRSGEIKCMDWSNVQDADSFIRMRPDQCKNQHGHSVPVIDELMGIIQRRREARTIQIDGTTTLSRFVFHRGDGLEIGDFRKSWAAACEAAGKPNLLFHDLRRAAVTALVNSGVPQLVAMSISGHKTDSMFKRYAIKIEDEQVAAMQAVAAYHAKKIAQAEQKRSVVSISK
jgi:integrase